MDSEKDDKNIKRKAYLKIYQKKALIYIVILLVLMIILGYISICYFGIFKNTKTSIRGKYTRYIKGNSKIEK